MVGREGAGNGTGVRCGIPRAVPSCPERGSVWCGPGGQVAPQGQHSYPGSAIGARAARRDDTDMEVITPPPPVERRSFVLLLAPTVVGTLMVVGGLVLAFLAFLTPIVRALMPQGRADMTTMAVGVLIWTVALVAPAAFLFAGTTRLARILATIRRRVPTRTGALRALGDLPSDVVVASGLVLADGRGVSDVILGPFGAAVIRELPPAAVTRINEGHWQLRTRRGWIPLENPLDRAVRDGERVRRWLAHDDADFVVKVYSAVVGPSAAVPRTTACAVLTPEQLGPWIAALPPQRSLTEGRRERMVEMAREAVRG